MNWDKYFYELAKIVASKSKCLSRQIGAVLAKNNAVVSTGYNGPPRGVSHCGEGRLDVDKNLRDAVSGGNIYKAKTIVECPRQLLGYESGQGLHLCPAVHAEANCIAQAAMNGIAVLDTVMYVTCEVPCKDCLGLMIDAGIRRVVCTSETHYDELTPLIIDSSRLEIVRYDFDG